MQKPDDDWSESSDLTPVDAVQVALARRRLNGNASPSVAQLMEDTGMSRSLVLSSLEKIRAMDEAERIVRSSQR